MDDINIALRSAKTEETDVEAIEKRVDADSEYVRNWILYDLGAENGEEKRAVHSESIPVEKRVDADSEYVRNWMLYDLGEDRKGEEKRHVESN
ncbi:hypothetical protein Tdes44962_MAKER06724 [Teratosphaeria destructans]|uniref:Uncharacterized protein n=1 Tax=Teratosphaeria destructans TaxID=418781 RepID=A0A9W7T1K0_9PEZI|nr:hypothetical protein Tdes44962_MAKER06724 [Teratosphaeria destructans]